MTHHDPDRRDHQAVTHNPPYIPEPPFEETETSDWHDLGHYDVDLTTVLGWYGDDEAENQIARQIRDRLRETLQYLNSDQLRAYLNGVQTGLEELTNGGL